MYDILKKLMVFRILLSLNFREISKSSTTKLDN